MFTGAAATTSVLAGCLGDDDPDDEELPEDSDDPADDDHADDTAPPEDDQADGVEDGEEAIPEIHDATFVDIGPGDLPADIQYNQYAEEPFLNSLWGNQEALVTFSLADFEIHDGLIDNRDYDVGVLEMALHDDIYWWNGDQLLIDDIIGMFEFEDYLWGGDELDAREDIVAFEKIDDRTLRFTFPDTWHESWAMHATIADERPRAHRSFYEPWLEEFEDAPDLDAVIELRDEVEADAITEDERLVDMFYSPFEFRLEDDGYGTVGEDYWELELVPEKNGELRHLLNPEHHHRYPNYERVRFVATEEGLVRREESFFDQDHPWVRWRQEFADEAGFDTEWEWFHIVPTSIVAVGFNFENHPGDNVHFRRAMAFAYNNTEFVLENQAIPIQEAHPFLRDEIHEAYVSDEVIDAYTDYGWDEARWDDAETELEAGGFERDADGNWLMQEDSPEADAGEPMDMTIRTFPWGLPVWDYTTDFVRDINDFGIRTEVLDTDDAWGESEENTIDWTDTGGLLPAIAFGNVFDEIPPHMSAANVPSVNLGPELLETNEAGDPTDDWIEWETQNMAQRLPSTVDDEMYQQLVDNLAWVYNQTVPQFGTAIDITSVVMNDEQWSFVDHGEHPEMVPRGFWELSYNGAYMYVPEEER